MLHDLRYAIRRLRSSPGFSLVAVATIALAIGANTAMFSFVKGVFLNPLPYPDESRIVRVLERRPTGGVNSVSTMNYLDWTKQNTIFQYIAAEVGWRVTLTGAQEPLSIPGARVSAHYFDIFGTTAALGRTFAPGEDQPGRDHVVLLSHLLWERRFGADHAMVGRTISLNGEPYTVIGVLPGGGPFDRASAQIWAPLAFEPADMTRDFRWLAATAKLEPGVTVGNARAYMDVIAQRLASAYPSSNKGWGIAVDRLSAVLIGPGLQSAVTILFAATVFVLLIGCANVANLAVARRMSQENEMSVRAALGAGRWRLIRQVLVEHVVISVCGGTAAILVGGALLRWIQSLIPPYALPPAVDIRMDTTVLLFTLIVAVLTGVLVGIAPASHVTSRSLADALREDGHGTTAANRARRVHGALVAGEIALAFVLLVASGLLMRSIVKLLDVDPGFNPGNVLTAGVPVNEKQHRAPAELNAYLASITAAVEAVPGVRETALTSALPLQGWGFGVSYAVADRARVDPADRRRGFFKMVSPSYFTALGIKVLAGRGLSERDIAGAQPVAIINDVMARREFPGESPIGRHLLVQQIVPGKAELGEEIAWEIVGVVAAEKINDLGDQVSAGMYVSTQQSPTYALNLLVRASTPPESLQRTVRSAVARVNRDQALSDMRTLEQIVEQSMLGNRFVATVLAVFASIALLLAALGIYGVIAYTAAQRTREMGIRAALGASAGSLRWLIYEEGMRLTLIGLAVGLVGTGATTGLISSMLYGIGTYDPATIVMVTLILFGVAVAACVVAPWRITKADPMEALRYE